EKERMGADCLTIPMFASEHRIETAAGRRYQVVFEPEMVFAGVGASSQLLKPGVDYRYANGSLEFSSPPGGLVDCYAGIAWRERFTPDEMVKRRRQCKTINEWDSQYQLHSRPLHEVRLDPARLRPYNVEPVIKWANGGVTMWLGGTRIVGGSCRWDPSSGKLHSDVSSVALVLQDDRGVRYWHRSLALTGEVAEFASDGKTINGGQVLQLVGLVKQFGIRRVSIETNGIGGFAPAVLKAALKQGKIHDCGVAEIQSTGNKNKRILEAIEDPLRSGQLWAHTSVLDGDAYDVMREWNPAVAQQPDDSIDALAGAIAETPERFGAEMDWNPSAVRRDDWRPSAGVHEVELEG